MSRREQSARADDPLAGTCYRVVRRIGEGASSEVFEALDPLDGRVAVKILRAHQAACAEARWRLRLEGRALAALDHPSLVPVIDAGATADGRPFLVMPRLEGETLQARLRREERLRPAAACALVGQALLGLGAAHGAGVIHRDVKPGNLFLAEGRAPGSPAELAARRVRVVVLDFGIAKVLGATGGPVTGAHVLGTPRYLAPEQVLGGEVDARTDVYAAGVVLFEAIAGRSPYDAEGPGALMLAHVRARPRRLAELCTVGSELDRVVARALAKPPAERWPSAPAFAAALQRCARLAIACERGTARSEEATA
jgi:serine/threonine-protein kinase